MRAVIAMFLLASAASHVSAAEIENVKFPEAYRFDDVTLKLNNVGLMRYRYVFKAMVAGLYVTQGTPTEDVLTDIPKRLEAEYFWAVKAKDLVDASEKLLVDNVDARTRRELRTKFDQIHALYEDVQPGDRYALTYLPGRGTYLSLNGKTKGLVAGAKFGAAYFSIWLGKKPMDASLKQQLLSGRR